MKYADSLVTSAPSLISFVLTVVAVLTISIKIYSVSDMLGHIASQLSTSPIIPTLTLFHSTKTYSTSKYAVIGHKCPRELYDTYNNTLN